MAVSTPPCDFGWRAPGFDLPATDGKRYTLEDVRGPKGALVMVICNHCPYVLAVIDKIVRDARDLQALGVGAAAICANDAATHPQDGFEPMARMAEQKGFPFPYLHDESQDVARAYGAVCTPDFFGFDADLGLRYRGRLDATESRPGPADLPRELYAAMKQIAETGRGPTEQNPSMGCSIKWKAA